MHPTLFTIGNVNVATYTVLLDLGLVLGLVVTYFEGRRRMGSGEIALDLGLWVIIGGVVGGRIAYVLANWTAFQEDLLRSVRIWEGGLSVHGAFLGGLAVMVLFAWLQARSSQVPAGDLFWQLADVLTPGLAVGVAFGWAACLMGGCAYGALGEGWGYAVLPDLYGVQASRFATQALGLAYALVLLLGFWLLRGRWPFSGAEFLMYLLLYFAGQFFLEFTRGDEALYLAAWRLPQVLDVILVVVSAIGLVALWRQNERAEVTGDAPATAAEGPEKAGGDEPAGEPSLPLGRGGETATEGPEPEPLA